MSSEPPVRRLRDRYREDDTGWISFGAFLIIAAVIYLITPNIVEEVEAFVRDFRLVEVFPNFWWFVPSTNHPVLYNAATQFCYAFGVVQIGVLGLRFARRSSIHGKAETVSSVIFWLGTGYLLTLFSQGVFSSWLSFIGAFIILVGISIVVRALVMALAHRGPP